jgi:DNA polymerase-3 subunit delta
MGLLDQELAKLAGAAGAGGTISREIVDDLVGGWRMRTAWEMIDAALGGNAPRAYSQLERLLAGGEVPVAVFGQLSYSLRQLAAAAHLLRAAASAGRRMTGADALAAAGVKPFAMGKAESQLRQVGLRRAGTLYRLLIDSDCALKGESSSGNRARYVIEGILARLSSAAAVTGQVGR